jgi:hypothetical protein
MNLQSRLVMAFVGSERLNLNPFRLSAREDGWIMAW